VIGGLLNSAGTNARLGGSRYLIAEADESDASFLHLQPMVAVVTNIDRDHLGTYGGDFARLQDVFVDFIHRLPFYGAAVLCIDDAPVRAMLDRVTRPMLTYGFAEDASYRAVDVRPRARAWQFRAIRPDAPELAVTINLPGQHNVQNALAAIAVATDEGVADDAIVRGLATFAGVGRRFQVSDSIAIGGRDTTLVDDYGHHPTEVRAVIDTARSVWPTRRIVMVYQPHRYTRTHDLYDDFVKVLSSVDKLVLLDVYSAGERPIAGADGHALAQGIRERGNLNPIFVADTAEALEILPGVVEAGDVVIVQGAGNVSQLSRHLRGDNES
jgi:UDP-N-acetylmuramate--alanine ligase